ncbi:MAG: hypothetical protein A3G34_17485 [Candidatus Lindowbacteria bacterium RIFCSPLOWO2_12_FULL_62_27]|nr:MAG: hypothetical protein A3G34_17485 [Candidatus Lindowbacteria bacterium RIFCSPLOWO2_12_FULL_62_27]
MSDTQRDLAGFAARIEQYTEAMQVKGHTPDTLNRAIYSFRKFTIWCEERGVLRPTEVTRPIVERFQRFLFHSINPRTDRPISLAYQNTVLTNLRSFFRWLAKQNLVLYNPVADIDIPRRDKRLPKKILNQEELGRVMNAPDLRTPLGLRDRAILETLYSTAIRRMEVCNLNVDDVDIETGIVFVRQGKGRKDRVVPIGERACRWIRAFLHDGRPHLVTPPDPGALFLTPAGRRMPRGRLTACVISHLSKCGVTHRGASHLFRHTCATHMLEGGADIRYIQAMLGHAVLQTTEIYTHVAIKKLKEIHTATHPAAKLKPDEQKLPEDGDVGMLPL